MENQLALNHTGFESPRHMVGRIITMRAALVGKFGQCWAVGRSQFEPSQESIDHLTAHRIEMPNTRATHQGIAALYTMVSKRAFVVVDSSTEKLPEIELVAIEAEHSIR
jgi:hypothetical protein